MKNWNLSRKFLILFKQQQGSPRAALKFLWEYTDNLDDEYNKTDKWKKQQTKKNKMKYFQEMYWQNGGRWL